MSDSLVLTEHALPQGRRLAVIELAAPASLNALTLPMVLAARTALQRWRADPAVVAVLMCGQGRAFCAGGDVRALRQSALAQDDYAPEFFAEEYRLDYAIHTYPKPLVCIGHGIVMGGGLGLMIGASHRVVTPSTRVAMPEVSIGLYPDVGGSAFLSALPNHLGLFLAFTGAPLVAADLLDLGWAEACLPDTVASEACAALCRLDWQDAPAANHQVVDRWLASVRITPPSTGHWKAMLSPMQAACASGDPVSVVRGILETTVDSPWWQAAQATLLAGCPVTLHLAAEAQRRARSLTLAEVFQMEWGVSVQCCRHPDFPEGVRAQLVDKDRSPRWSVASVTDVTFETVVRHFTPPSMVPDIVV